MDHSVTLAGLELEHPVMNAAGTCKRLDGNEGFTNLVRTSTSAVVMGSVTVEPRTGNEGDVYHYVPGLHSINSLGMPNPGMAYYQKHLPVMASMAHDAGKKIIVNVAGFSAAEYRQLAYAMFEAGADMVELNLGCPNIWAGSDQKPIASFVPELIDMILDHVNEEVGPSARIDVKLSPFSDPFALQKAAAVIGRYTLVKVVTDTNTFANGYSLDADGATHITPAQGLGGIGGPAMKPIGMGNVRQLRSLLHPNTQIIGVGGVMNGQDVVDYLRAGAVAVQTATAYLESGGRVFGDILSQYVELVQD